MEIQGTIYLIKNTQQVSASFQKREFILCVKAEKAEWKDQYLKCEAIQDKCELLDRFQVGDEVTVGINLRGNLYTRKDGTGEDSFISLSAWKINPVVNGQTGQGDQTPSFSAPVEVEDATSEEVPF